NRRAVGDQAETFLAFAQRLPRQHLVGDVEIGPDQAQRAPGAVAFDLGDDADPAALAVIGTDDAVFVGIVLAAGLEHAEQVPDGPLAVVGVDARDPVLIGLVGVFRRQPVDQQIFGGAAVAYAMAEIDLEAADPRDALDPRQLGLALLQRAVGAVALVRHLLK